MTKFRHIVVVLVAVCAAGAAWGTVALAGGEGRYSTRVVNSIAGGDPGFFYVGGPLNIRLIDRQGGTGRYDLCVTPAPIDKPSCRRARANRTVDSLAPSQVGLTKLRFEIPGRKVIVRFIRVRRAPTAG